MTPPTIFRIQRAVAEHFGIGVAAIEGDSIADRNAHPRQIAMYLAVRLTHHSKQRIGQFFDRTGTCVLAAYRRVQLRIHDSREVEASVGAVIDALFDIPATEAA